MKISDYMHDKILVQSWANDLVQNADLLDDLPVVCSHCKKEIKGEEKEYVEKFGICLDCEKVISSLNQK